MRTSSLDIQEDKNKEDLDSRILKIQMEDANKSIKTLTMEDYTSTDEIDNPYNYDLAY